MRIREMNYPKNYFHNPLQNLSVTGFWIHETKNRKYKILCFLWFVTLITCAGFYLLTEFTHIIMHSHEMEEVTLGLCYIFSHCMSKFPSVIQESIYLSAHKLFYSNRKNHRIYY